jgi:hypothetical protein
MKRAIIVGLFAGFVSGIVQAVLDISGVWELFSTLYTYTPLSVQNILVSKVIVHSFWGIIWCLLYAFFYDYIPDEGIKKGVVYGFIVWIVAATYPASIAFGYGFEKMFIPWLSTWFISIAITYGLLIGILYKKE